MENPNFCVYNLARRAFLSSKVTVSDTVNQPLKVLKDLVGLDAESGLWLSPLYGKPTIPKLFPYDIAYLDADFTVIEMAEIAPGVEFPPHRREVTSAVVLPPDALRRTKTQVGDHLLVCPKNQAEKQIAARSQESQAASATAPVEAAIEHGEEAAPVGLPAASGSDSASADIAVAAEAAMQAASTPPVQEPAAEIAKPAEASHETVAMPQIAARGDETPVVDAKPAGVSITEVVIEKPQLPDPQEHPMGEPRPGLEDLFANWVDSPTAPPSWIAQKAREHAAELSASESSVAKQSTAGPSEIAQAAASGERAAEAARPAAAQASGDPAASERKTEPRAPAVTPKAPVPPAYPKSAQKTSFTIAQYGMWQVSTPPAVSPVVPVRRPSNGAQGTNGGRRGVGGPKREGTPIARRAVGSTSVPPAREKEGAAASSTEKPPASRTQVKKMEPGTTMPIRPTTVLPKKVESPAQGSQLEQKRTTPPASGSDLQTGTKPVSGEIDRNQSRTGIGETSAPPATPAKSDFGATIQDKFERLQKTAMKAEAEKARAAAPQDAPLVKTETEKAPAAASAAQATSAAKTDIQTAPAAAPAAGEAPVVKPEIEQPPPAASPAQEALVVKAAVPATVPASAQSGAKEKAEPAAKAQPGKWRAAEKPAEPEVGKGAEQQQGVSVASPRILKPKVDEKGKPKPASDQKGRSGKNGTQPQGLGARLKRWLNPTTSARSDRRRALRRYVPGMVAHYFTGGAPQPHDVADISMSGMYLLTDDRWVPDTMIRMTLQKPCAKGERKQSITVLSRVVRRGSDGVAIEFVMEESLTQSSRDILPTQGTDRFSLARFL